MEIRRKTSRFWWWMAVVPLMVDGRRGGYGLGERDELMWRGDTASNS